MLELRQWLWPNGREQVVGMRCLSSDSSRLGEESGILTGRWTQYADLGELPFGAMWCVVPPGSHSEEDCHPERELQVVVNGSAVVDSAGTKLDAPLGAAILLDSYERHVVHNRSADQPLVLLSIYWMPEGAAEPHDG